MIIKFEDASSPASPRSSTTMSAATTEISQLFGLHPSSDRITSFLTSISALANISSVTPEVKAYSDAVYFNYFPLGLSLLFKPAKGYKPKTGLQRTELNENLLVLDGVDIYNPSKTDITKTKNKLLYSRYPVDAIALSLVSTPEHPRAEFITITPTTTGKEFVEAMGEPERKGGGAGPSSGSIGIWCEWTKDGVLIEFGGDESRGPQAWERGKDAVWKVITFFPIASA